MNFIKQMLFTPGLFRPMTQDEREFNSYVSKFGKNYATKEEYDFRFNVYKKNVAVIRQHPADSSFQLGVNHMTDWTDDEFHQISGKFNKKKKNKNNGPVVGSGVRRLPTNNLPERVNWRNKGAITTSINQNSCGSCWAWTTASALEAYNVIAGRPIVRLSP